MTLPGVSYSIRETAPPRSIPQGVDRWFVAGMTERGPIAATKVTSLEQFRALFGDRVSYGYTYDAIDVFFREGGAEAWIGRVVGPAPVTASANLFDTSGSTAPGDVSLAVAASSAGEWANDLDVEVEAGGGGGFVIVILDGDGEELERSPELADTDEAVAWATASSDYVTLTKGAGAAQNPRVQGPTSLAGGDSDYADATETEWAEALDLFTADLGSGQVSMPGRTTDASHAAVLAHAVAMNRVALLDGEDTGTVATLTATAAASRGLGGQEPRFGGLFAPWAIVPGELPGTTRTVPYSAVQAGLMARSDNAGNAPNTAAAGDNGIARYAIGLSQDPWSDDDRETLNDAGVNVARIVYGVVTTYGYRTLANPTTDPNWLFLGGSREVAYVLSKAQAIGETFMFETIDGRGRTIGRWNGALKAVLAEEYARDALYGETMEEAFLVDTGAQVNTPETIAEGQLRAVLAMKVSPTAERVFVEVVKVPTTESVA